MARAVAVAALPRPDRIAAVAAGVRLGGNRRRCRGLSSAAHLGPPSRLTSMAWLRILETVTFARRCSAAILTLALFAGNFGVCAGWAATPEARMACCKSGESCPMAHSEGDGDETPALTQAQADACCASAEPDGSTPSTVLAASAITVAVLGLGIVVPPPARIDRFHPASFVDPPNAATAVARHVLLTVFLI